MNNNDFSCPLCGSSHFQDVFFYPAIPVMANYLFLTPEDARNIPRGQLNIIQCRKCGFVTNKSFDQDKVMYNENYENYQGHSPCFLAHLEDICSFIKRYTVLNETHILEVGCGQGTFLQYLSNQLAIPFTAEGFDPAFEQQKNEIYPDISINKSLFHSEKIMKIPTIVISRHVIEHLQDPISFLQEIRSISDNPFSLFLETPDVSWIINTCSFWDFCYEHVSYFSPDTLKNALQNTGFVDVHISSVFQEQYLISGAKSGGSCVPFFDPVKKTYSENMNDVLQSIQNKIVELSSIYNLALWGAGAKGVSLANMTDINTEFYKAVIDINPNKQGKYIPGTGHPIIGVDDIRKYLIDYIIVMNPNYLDEITILVAKTGYNGKIKSIMDLV